MIYRIVMYTRSGGRYYLDEYEDLVSLKNDMKEYEKRRSVTIVENGSEGVGLVMRIVPFENVDRFEVWSTYKEEDEYSVMDPVDKVSVE